MEQTDLNEPPGSEARQVFQSHMNNVAYLCRVVLRDIEQLNNPIDDLENSLPDSTTARDTIAQLTAAIDASVQMHPYLFDWMLVMMITFAEAYLENVLILLTRAHPSWMATKKKLALSGAEVLELEATVDSEDRWQALMTRLRKRWAKQFLSDSPLEWINWLNKVGVRAYPAGLAEKMKRAWDRRHEVVHAPPVARSDQLTGSRVPATARYVESKSAFQDAISAIYSFVEATDAFAVVAARGPGGPAETSAG